MYLEEGLGINEASHRHDLEILLHLRSDLWRDQLSILDLLLITIEGTTDASSSTPLSMRSQILMQKSIQWPEDDESCPDTFPSRLESPSMILKEIAIRFP